MQVLTDFIVICCIALLVVHINSQLKDSETDNVFTTQYFDNGTLDKKCRLRQPLIISTAMDLNSLDSLNYEAIKKSKGVMVIDAFQSDAGDTGTIEFVPAYQGLEHANKGVQAKGDEVFLNNVAGSSFTEKLRSKFAPYFTITSNIVYKTAKLGSSTNPEKGLNDRTFIIPTSGELSITLWSKTNSAQIEGKTSELAYVEETSSIDKSKGQTFIIRQGDAVFVPRNWWYSVEFGEETGFIVVRYQTCVNALATCPVMLRKLVKDHNLVTRYTSLDDT